MEPHEELTNRRTALAHAVQLAMGRDAYEKPAEILADAALYLAFLNGEEAAK